MNKTAAFLFVYLFLCSPCFSQQLPAIEKELGGLGQELPATSFELCHNGKNLFLELGDITKSAPVKTPKDGVDRYVLRVSPFQLAKMETIQFRYPYPARAFVDTSAENTVVRVYHQAGYAIIVTDFGGPLQNQNDAKQALDILEKTIKEQLTGEQKNPEIVSRQFDTPCKNATIRGVSVQMRLRYTTQNDTAEGKAAVQTNHNDVYETLGWTISTDKMFATVVVQMFDHPTLDAKDDIMTMLNSFELKRK